MCKIWVIDESIDDATLERLGDARHIADIVNWQVGVLLIGSQQRGLEMLGQYGADCILHIISPQAGPETRIRASLTCLEPYQPRLILASGVPQAREWAARLAVRAKWRLVSPALVAQIKEGQLVISALSYQGHYCRSIPVGEDECAVITLQPDVAEALSPDKDRTKQVDIQEITFASEPEALTVEKKLPADPATVDIRYAPRLVAGGRGLGSREGVELLGRFAKHIDAGMAASRMAVDLGWIERERQVGQTGKTVQPELYIACGISGASHHLAGMSRAKHIVAINTDPEAPIFGVAHLGLVADLHQTLKRVEEWIS